MPWFVSPRTIFETVLVVGSRELGVGSWESGVGSWQLAVGSGQWAVGGGQSGVGSWELGVGGQLDSADWRFSSAFSRLKKEWEVEFLVFSRRYAAATLPAGRQVRG